MKRTIRIVVSGLLLAWLAWRTDWSQVHQSLAGLEVGLWLASAGLYLLAQVASVCRWRLLARPLGFHVPLGRYLTAYFTGMFFNLFLPTSVGGDVIRAWYLNGGSGRALPALVTVIVDRMNGLAALLVLACGGVLFCPIDLPGWVRWSVWLCAGGMAAGFAGLLAWSGRADGRLGAPRFRLVRALGQALARSLRQPRVLLAGTVLSFVIQALNVLVVGLIGRGLHLEVPAGYWWVVVPMISLVTLLPISLNGMGVREGGLILLLAPLGVPASAALSLAWLWFAIFLAASVIGGGVYLFSSTPRPEEKNDETVRGDSDQGRERKPAAAA